MKASGVGIVATILAGVCFGAGGTSTPTGFTDDFDAALKASATSSRPVVVVFSGSDWCGWCKKLEKEVFAQKDFLKDATNRYTLVYVDSPQNESLLSATAAKRNPELVKKYAIQGFPTVFVLDAKGCVLGKTGYRRGGGAAYLKHLDGIVANGPLVAKHLKPHRDAFETLTAEFQREAEKLFKEDEDQGKASKAAAKEKVKALASEYRKKAKAIRKRFRAETIPDQIKAEKDELLSDMKSFIRGMRLLAEEKEKT